MMDYEELLNAPSVSEVDLDFTARALGEPPGPFTPRSTMLHLLGRGNPERYLSVVKRFLEYRQDPWLARVALEVITIDWKMTNDFLPTLYEFARGVPWDEDGDVQTVALSAAGEYLRGNSDPILLGILIHVFESTDELTSAEAYSGLARALGRSWPSTTALGWTYDRDGDPDVVIHARDRLQRELSEHAMMHSSDDTGQ
ncbi:MAG: hypothetical protein WKF41_05675 [Gaiellaceae bacterium]